MTDESWERLKEAKARIRDERAKYFIRELLPAITAFCEEHALMLIRLNEYSWRIQRSTTRQENEPYVDVWTTRAMRKVDGSQSGFGYADKTLWSELTKLALKL